jgi:hypothetical protein
VSTKIRRSTRRIPALSSTIKSVMYSLYDPLRARRMLCDVPTSRT